MAKTEPARILALSTALLNARTANPAAEGKIHAFSPLQQDDQGACRRHAP